jgi:pimeloyl-ACP methyl ester carboxylesterase
MTARHCATGLGAAGIGAAAAGALLLRRADARWRAAGEPFPDGDTALPHGDDHTVRTDDGAELAATVAGDGTAGDVVLAHGWTNSRAVWAPVAHRLVRRGHRVVLYDQRGHGASTVGDDGFTIPRLGADLRAVLEALDVRGAVLAGHSMGGMTVQALATHHLDVLDERARAIVLVATAASGLGRGRGDARAARVIASPVLDRVMRAGFGHAMVRGTFGATVHHANLVLMRDLFVATKPEVRLGWLTAMQAMDLREGIARIGLPTTIVSGGRDRLTPPDRSAELADHIPGAELITLEHAGHMLQLEAPDAVADAIARAHDRRPERERSRPLRCEPQATVPVAARSQSPRRASL